MELYNCGLYEEAIPLLETLADNGSPDAREILGDCYYHGRGVMQDHSIAYWLYRTAAQLRQCLHTYNELQQGNAREIRRK
jgi:TPR repeat protein